MPSEAKPKKRHHYVPRAYLRFFADESGKLRVCLKDQPGKVLYQSPDRGLDRAAHDVLVDDRRGCRERQEFRALLPNTMLQRSPHFGCGMNLASGFHQGPGVSAPQPAGYGTRHVLVARAR